MRKFPRGNIHNWDLGVWENCPAWTAAKRPAFERNREKRTDALVGTARHSGPLCPASTVNKANDIRFQRPTCGKCFAKKNAGIDTGSPIGAVCISSLCAPCGPLMCPRRLAVVLPGIFHALPFAEARIAPARSGRGIRHLPPGRGRVSVGGAVSGVSDDTLGDMSPPEYGTKIRELFSLTPGVTFALAGAFSCNFSACRFPATHDVCVPAQIRAEFPVLRSGNW
jgi:hypothetical protein